MTRFFRTALTGLLFAAAIGLSACSLSNGGSPPIATSDAGRFLTQATFGVTDADISSVQAIGYGNWIVQQQAIAPTGLHQAYVDARLLQLQAATPGATLSPNQFYETFWAQAATGQDQLRQRVKFALSEIFVISMVDPNVDVRGAASYYDMLGANAFGNYRNLLQAVTLHPMMGNYLTSIENQKEDPTTGRHPDENYAREVMQLMTIGLYKLNDDGTTVLDGNGNPIPTYGQSDIQDLAKVFTGMSWYSPSPTNSTFLGGNRDSNADVKPMILYPNYHSISQKTFLGVTIPASTTPDPAGDIRIALDTLFNHPNVGPFISHELIQRLVTSNPSPAYVNRVATVFNNDGTGVRGNMAAVISAILTDAEARSSTLASANTYGKVREPIVRMGNWMRTFKATSASGHFLFSSTSVPTSLDQSPLTSGSVFNFYQPGYVPPKTRVGGLGLTAPELQIVDEVSTAGYLNTMQNTIGSGIGSGNDVQSAYSGELAVASDANALADRMNRLLLNGSMSATLKSKILTAVTSVAIPGGTATQAQINAALLNRAKLAVFVTMASPEYLVQR